LLPRNRPKRDSNQHDARRIMRGVKSGHAPLRHALKMKCPGVSRLETHSMRITGTGGIQQRRGFPGDCPGCPGCPGRKTGKGSCDSMKTTRGRGDAEEVLRGATRQSERLPCSVNPNPAGREGDLPPERYFLRIPA
jgi:hypothetical protein